MSKPANATEALRELVAAHDACAAASLAFNEQLKKHGSADCTIPSAEATRLGAAWYDARAVLAEPPKDGDTNKDAGSGVRAIGPTQQGITASGCPSKDGLANLEAGSQSGPASPVAALIERLRETATFLENWNVAFRQIPARCVDTIREAADALARLAAPVPELTERERGVLRHALTGGRDVTPYRNHFAADEGHADMPTLRALVARGLMVERKNKSPITPDTLFHCTEAGAKVVGLHLPNDSRDAAPVPRQDFNEVVQQARENVRPLIEAEAKRGPIDTGVIYDNDGKSADRGQQGVRSESDGAGNVGHADDGKAGDVHDQAHPRRSATGSEGGRRVSLRFDNEWLRKHLADEDCDPPSCPHGVMAGVCPACAAAPVPAQKWAPLLDPPDEERALYDAAEYVETGGLPSPDQHMRLCKVALKLAALPPPPAADK